MGELMTVLVRCVVCGGMFEPDAIDDDTCARCS